jgi:flagellar protein FliO/FliZ
VFRLIIIFLLIFSAYTRAHALNLLKGVSITEENNQFMTVYEFTEPFDPSMVQTNVHEKMVQVMFPNAEMATDKNSIHVGRKGITAIDSIFEGPDLIKSNINFEKAVPPMASGENIKVIADKNMVKVFVVNEPLPATVTTNVDIKNKQLKESEVPAFSSAIAGKKTKAQSPYVKLMISLLVIALMSGGLIYFSRWYTKNHKKNVINNQIKVLANHALGPRKQLMIIRVAGESMLIGVTDQNISMLKSLSLIDEEIPAQMPVDFTHSMDAADTKYQAENKPKAKAKSAAAQAENEVDEFVISGITDKISTKLKGMRDI